MSTGGGHRWWSISSLTRTDPIIDNLCFRLYSRHSAVIFILLATLVLGHSYFTDVIDCVSGDNLPWGVIDAICYVQGTFSIASAWQKQVGHEVPYPGIENYQNNEDRVYHHYYKWIGWTFLLQAALFYLPGYFWRCVERGRTSAILKRFEQNRNQQRSPGQLQSAFGIDQHARPLQPGGVPIALDPTDPTFGFLTISARRENLALMIGFVLFELLNLAVLVLQTILINQLLNRQFIGYGWLTMFSGQRPDIRTRLFPDQAKCSLLRFTSSGDIQRIDSTCVLSSNFLYGQLYLFVWAWFHFLLVASLMSFLFRILTLAWPYGRVLRTSAVPIISPGPSEEIRKLIERLPLGSWFLLNLLSKNLDRDQYGQLLKQLSTQLNKEGYLGAAEVKANGNGAA